MEVLLAWIKENWDYIVGSGGALGMIQFVRSF